MRPSSGLAKPTQNAYTTHMNIYEQVQTHTDINTRTQKTHINTQTHYTHLHIPTTAKPLQFLMTTGNQPV